MFDCSVCGGKTKVLETRYWPRELRRRRKCLTKNCGHVFWTAERAKNEKRNEDSGNPAVGNNGNHGANVYLGMG